jgi:glycosyltransferase involved in cell wall biosynthesis
MDLSELKIAIVHDWLTHFGGAERCLEEFCEIFPQADIFTLVYKEGSVGQKIESHNIKTSFLQKIPLSQKFYRHLLPLMPIAIEQFKFNGYDLVISSSHAVTKGVITPTDCLHISYMYTPMRYIWFMRNQYFGSESNFPHILRPLTAPFLHYLRVWDKSSAKRVDKYIAISRFVSKRIKKIYRKDSQIIYPPVDTDKFLEEPLMTVPPQLPQEDYFLMISNYEPNKNTELVVQAFTLLVDEKLKIAGSFGRRGEYLKNKYYHYDNIEFLGRISDGELMDHYSRAKALIAPGNEDFGMSVLEANASKTPVIAYAKGGHLETVNPALLGPFSSKVSPDSTGIFFHKLDVSDIIVAIEKFNYINNKGGWNEKYLQTHAKRFDKKIFREKIQKTIRDLIKK